MPDTAKVAPPLPDVESVCEETSARETNRMLRQGWRLLQVIHAHDGAGGYPCYVLGKPRQEVPQNEKSPHDEQRTN